MKNDEKRRHRVFGFATLGLLTAGLVAANFDALRLAGVCFGLALISAVIFAKLYLEYLRKSGKVKGFLGRLLEALFRGLGRAVKALQPVGRRLGAAMRKIIPRNPLRLTNFKDEKMSLFRRREKKRVSPYRRMKWKNLTNDTDRVRYVYYTFMAKRIRRGFTYRPSQTPREVCDDMWRGGKQGVFNVAELFDKYNVYRYKRVNTDGQVDGLKKFI